MCKSFYQYQYYSCSTSSTSTSSTAQYYVLPSGNGKAHQFLSSISFLLCTRHHFLRLIVPNSPLEGLRPHRHVPWNYPKIHRHAGIIRFVWLGKVATLVAIETYPLASIQHERGEISLVRRRLTKQRIRTVHLGKWHPKINFPIFKNSETLILFHFVLMYQFFVILK